MAEKTERIVIYCRKDIKKMWYNFIVDANFKSNESAIIFLLKLWEKEKQKHNFRIRELRSDSDL